MPIFELFISMLECAEETDANGVSHVVNHYAHNLICWYGEHYVHATLAILVSVAFVIICIVVSITYYESKTSHNNHSARINSRAGVFLLVSKIISILLFGFFNKVSHKINEKGKLSMDTRLRHIYSFLFYVFKLSYL